MRQFEDPLVFNELYNKKKNRHATSVSKAGIKKLEEQAAAAIRNDAYHLHPFMGEDLK